MTCMGKESKKSMGICTCITDSLSEQQKLIQHYKSTIKVTSVVSDSLRPYGPEAHQGSLSMGFSKQTYWSGLPCPSPGDLPNPRIKPRPPTLWPDSLLPEPPEKPKSTILKLIPFNKHFCGGSHFSALHCRHRTSTQNIKIQGRSVLQRNGEMYM